MMRATADARLRNRAAAKVALLNVTFGIEALSAHLESRLALGAGNGAPDAAATRTRERWRLAITKVRSLGVAAGALALGNGAPDARATRTRERWRLAITKVRQNLHSNADWGAEGRP